MCVCVCVCVYRILIQSSVDGHLGCFRVLAIVNSAALNTKVRVSFQISTFVFSVYISRSGMLNHMEVQIGRAHV